MSVRLESLSQLIPSGESGISKLSDDGAAKAAQGLEAMFLRYLLSQMRGSSKGGLLDGGYAGNVFRQFLDEAMADATAAAGGVGLGEELERQMAVSRNGQGAAGADSPPPLPGLRAARRAYARQPNEIIRDEFSRKSEDAAQDRQKADESPPNGGR
jgi:flagellar protein FlgJ